MNNNNASALSAAPRINAAALDKKNYTLSLLMVCEEQGLLTSTELGRIKNALSSELTSLCVQYTCGESSTVPVEIAAKIYASLLYTTDLYLCALTREKAISALKQREFSAIIDGGRQLLLHYFDESKEIFRRAFRTRLPFPVFSYREVMLHAFDDFCNAYDARFDARNIPASIDYPLLGKAAYEIEEEGVLYIREYYRSIAIENAYCISIGVPFVRELLKTSAKRQHTEVSELYGNIARLAFYAHIANLLTGNNGRVVATTEAMCGELTEKYGLLTIPELKDEILSVMHSSRCFTGVYYDYFAAYVPKLAEELFERLRGRGLWAFLSLG